MSNEAAEGASDKPEELPKLTPAELREFNKLAELMDSYVITYQTLKARYG
jgi:hypothetical protein